MAHLFSICFECRNEIDESLSDQQAYNFRNFYRFDNNKEYQK